MKGIEQIVLVSNDSDLVPLLESIKEDFPKVNIAFISPNMKNSNNRALRTPNKKLAELSHWTRSSILEKEFENAQLPEKIKTNKKPIIKPSYW